MLDREPLCLRKAGSKAFVTLDCAFNCEVTGDSFSYIGEDSLGSSPSFDLD